MCMCMCMWIQADEQDKVTILLLGTRATLSLSGNSDSMNHFKKERNKQIMVVFLWNLSYEEESNFN